MAFAVKCRKEIVLTGYRLQFVDLREPKPRTPQEQIHVVDRQWLEALALTGQTAAENIRQQYERAGYKVFSVESITPKRAAEIDLLLLWEQLTPPATEEVPATTDSEVCLE